MTTTILASRLTVATIVKQLLARAGVAASAARLPESRPCPHVEPLARYPCH
jgi:hypothetical protein